MCKTPLVSIVTPSFNQGQFIEETILSVINQTYKNIQYIIIDGGSSDSTIKIINKYIEKIDIFINEKDKGQTDAINKGFKLAKGDLIGWINSDDILYPDCVEKIVELYNKNIDGAIFYSSFNDIINGKSQRLNTYQINVINKNYLLNYNYSIIQQGSFYKTDLIKKIDYLNENIHYCMDLDLWLRLLNYGSIYAYNKKSLSAFRIWEGTKTTNGRYLFFREIRKILLLNGANMFSRNIRRTYWYEIKDYVKRFIFHI